MTTSSARGFARIDPGYESLAVRFRQTAFGLPALLVLAGLAAAPLQPWIAFLAVAAILGWTQLAGL